jgi:hypothetical protein
VPNIAKQINNPAPLFFFDYSHLRAECFEYLSVFEASFCLGFVFAVFVAPVLSVPFV